MKAKDKIIVILAMGTVSSLVILVIGELFISARSEQPINGEILTVIKMCITGLLGIVAGYMGGRSDEGEKG